MNRTNKTYLVTRIGPCPRCGFAGEINDHMTATQLGKAQHIITCPTCSGAGKERTEVDLAEALEALGITEQGG